MDDANAPPTFSQLPFSSFSLLLAGTLDPRGLRLDAGTVSPQGQLDEVGVDPHPPTPRLMTGHVGVRRCNSHFRAPLPGTWNSTQFGFFPWRSLLPWLPYQFSVGAPAWPVQGT